MNKGKYEAKKRKRNQERPDGKYRKHKFFILYKPLSIFRAIL